MNEPLRFEWTGDLEDDCVCGSVPGYLAHAECMSDGKGEPDEWGRPDSEYWYCGVYRKPWPVPMPDEDHPLSDTANVSPNWLPWSLAKGFGPAATVRDYGPFVRHEYRFHGGELARSALSRSLITLARSSVPA